MKKLQNLERIELDGPCIMKGRHVWRSPALAYNSAMRACTQCGKCCLKYDGGDWLGSATEADMLGWVIHKPEVLDYVDYKLHDLWISPVTGKKMQRCPWLRKLPGHEKYNCRIHDVRPEVCRDYPIDIDQMIDLDCEMLEAGDLDKPHTQLLIELNKLRNASA